MPDKVWYRGVEKNKLVFKRCRPVMARYEGCGVCMKVCPIQKYGMKPVMEHYVATDGEILGKGTENLEGYALSDKGYFGSGQLPSFKRDFFDMPQGRAEDWIFVEFRNKLMDIHGGTNGHGNGNGNGHTDDEMWDDFRSHIEESIETRQEAADMGMDRGI
jgi:ferredoxin